MSLLRFFVTVVVGVPLFLAVGWPHPWWTTFLLALVAISAGYGVEALVKRVREPADSRPAEATSTDQRWELNMLLKKAIAAEQRAKWDKAITLFEQVVQKAERPEDIELARRHIQEIAAKRSLAGGA
jgi:hypothetical protein